MSVKCQIMIDRESTFELIEDGKRILLVVEPHALNKMLSFRQLRINQDEAGGILIGERRGNNFVVTEVTTPSPIDTSSRYHFVRKGSHHQKHIDSAYERSDGKLNYLGEWHTHPERIASPSRTDFINWKKSLGNHLPSIVAVVGTYKSWWGLHFSGNYRQLLPIDSYKY